MKNALRVIAVVVVAAILFGIGYGLGAQKGITVNLKVESSGNSGATVNTNTATATTATTTSAPTAAPSSDQTEAPASSDEQTEAPTQADDNTEQPADNAGESTGVPSSTAEIVAKYNEVINAAKALQNGTIHKTSTTEIEVTDLSVSWLKNSVNKIVSGLVSPSDETYTFTNGTDANGKTASNVITPDGRDVALTADGVVSATATPDGDGYKMTITLAAEKSSFDGTNTVDPVYHESCLSPLNLATLDISPAKITSADMDYPGATLNVTVDGQGRVSHYDFTLPMSGSGTGSLGASLDVSLEGKMVETFDITY